MKNIEIREIKEYCWGQVVTTIEDNKPNTIIIVRACYLGAATLLLTVLAFFIGFGLGKL